MRDKVEFTEKHYKSAPRTSAKSHTSSKGVSLVVCGGPDRHYGVKWLRSRSRTRANAVELWPCGLVRAIPDDEGKIG